MDIEPAEGLPQNFDYDAVIEAAADMRAELQAEIEDLQRKVRFLDCAVDTFQKAKAKFRAAHEAALYG
jgi:hypothetical protein